MEESLALSDNKISNVAQFFAGRQILVTGGSGFIGKLLIEKLLRSCPDIAKLYMFMRSKKGKTSQDRFKEHFEDILYNRLKLEQPNYTDKVILVEGDTGLPNLGLSPEDRNLLIDTEVIFHGAATVKFDEKLRIATTINVKGTKELFLFAKKMPNLKAFVYIGTAFSYCVLKCINEVFYTPPISTDNLLTLIDIFDDEKLEKISKILLDKWPNTYALTKAVAEDTVRRYSTGIPTCIIRPSMVLATLKDPIPSWIDNLYGPTGAVVGAAIGLLRTIYCKEENIADIIPADYVIANIIVAAWDTAQNRKISPSITNLKPDEEPKLPDTDVIPIYNCISSVQNPINWSRFMKLNEYYGLESVHEKVIWYYMLKLNRYLFMHRLYEIFFHLVPAAVIDTLAFLTGRKPILWKIYKKIHKFSGVISYFAIQEWRFRNDAVMELWEKLNSVDRKIFDFNLNSLDWDEYFFHYLRGIRSYIFKEQTDDLEPYRVKYARLKITHYSILTIVSLLLLWGFMKFILFFWSFCPWSKVVF